MATHSSTLAWKIPWTEEPGRLQYTGSLGVTHEWATSLSRIGEGNGNPLQCSCLENPREGEPGGLPSMGSHRVGLNWSNLAAAATLGSDVPTVSLSPEKNIIQSHAPQHSFQHYLQEPRHKPSKMSTDRLKLKKDLVLIDNGLLFSNEELTLQLWNHSTCSHRNGCWRITY